ncbi:hypothetical protein PENTCL1PPCAC_18671, partial [Pristionchus entomophagus]
ECGSDSFDAFSLPEQKQQDQADGKREILQNDKIIRFIGLFFVDNCMTIFKKMATKGSVKRSDVIFHASYSRKPQSK